MIYNEEELIKIHNNYGKLDSVLLKEIQKAGFKPIGISVMMCEETFIFKGDAEAKEAAKQFLPEGWWYGLTAWVAARQEYIKEIYNGIDENAPLVYWIDKNFAPKIPKYEIFNTENQ